MVAELPKEYKMQKVSFFKFTLILLITSFILFLGVGCNSQAASVNIQKDDIPESSETETEVVAETSTEDVIVQQADYEEELIVSDISNGQVSVDVGDVENGVVTVKTDVNTDANLVIKAEKDETVVYYYVDEDNTTKIPLTYGNGTYTLTVFENISGNEYQNIFSTTVDGKLIYEDLVYLQSNEIVNFEDSEVLESEILSIVSSDYTEEEKIDAVYQYVLSSYVYDYNKIDNLDSSYVPDIDELLSSDSGICYDFSAITASMLRSLGIPTKLVMGYRTDSNVYHAWNEILINDEWYVIDTTWDISHNVDGSVIDSVQSADMYSVEKVY
jgi:transglutaminase-like putative cysteine protease